jgi:hypothetical protein
MVIMLIFMHIFNDLSTLKKKCLEMDCFLFDKKALCF